MPCTSPVYTHCISTNISHPTYLKSNPSKEQVSQLKLLLTSSDLIFVFPGKMSWILPKTSTAEINDSFCDACVTPPAQTRPSAAKCQSCALAYLEITVRPLSHSVPFQSMVGARGCSCCAISHVTWRGFVNVVSIPLSLLPIWPPACSGRDVVNDTCLNTKW